MHGCYPDACLRMFSRFVRSTIRGAESTILYYTKKFCEAVICAFEKEYLREPSRSDIEMQLQSSERRGFPGCMGSLDCMHWQWELCPAAFKGQFQGKEGKPTVVLEVVADKRLRIWHFFFGSAGSNNDINIIDRSPLVNLQILRADAFRSFEFTLAGKRFDQLYYLVDGIYPPYSCFVSTISKPANAKQKRFAERQEGARKDVERAFSVLRAKFRILKQPSRTWSADDLLVIMKACVILHNMVVENNYANDVDPAAILHRRHREVNDPASNSDSEYEADPDNDVNAVNRCDNNYEARLSLNEFIQRRLSKADHEGLKTALIDHIWSLQGSAPGPC